MKIEEIKLYVENFILPQYENFDKGHDISHAEKVIKDSLIIAGDFNVCTDMVYVIAAYHDLGLRFGRENHEKNSGDILINDKQLEKWFTRSEIIIMKEAVEDHRASNDYEPRSIYGKIVAEADRDIVYETILTRTIQFSLKNCPDFNREQHFERSRDHISSKYGENGYLKLWLETEKNLAGLREIREALKNEEQFRSDFDRLFEIERKL